MNTNKAPLPYNQHHQFLKSLIKTAGTALVISMSIISCSQTNKEKVTTSHVLPVTEDTFLMINDSYSAETLAYLLFPNAQMPSQRTRSLSFAPSEYQEEIDLSKSNVIGLPVNFEFDSKNVLPESRPILDTVGQMLNLERLVGRVILIEGHADARGDADYNLKLSERRAKAIKAYLLKFHNIDSFKVRFLGKGEQELLADLDPYHPRNRRVTIKALR